MPNQNYLYNVALSFAGEDRKYAQELAQALKNRDIDVFYDKYEKATLWGKNLYTHLSEVYQKQARFCVMFLSQHYAQKLWTNHEREAAQARAFQDNEIYILPIRLDDTPIPGILPTIGYLKWSNADSIADDIVEKLKQETPSQPQSDFINRNGNSDFTKLLSSDHILKEQKSLSGQWRKKLQDALINAFPDKFSLDMMLSNELDKNLNVIAGGSNLREIVFNLIRTAEAEGWVEELIEAARNSNPGNPRLRTLDLQPPERKGGFVETERSNQQSLPPQNNPIPGHNYEVQPGDTLMTIALKAYGKGKLSRNIHDANKDVIDDPDFLKPGTLLYIPQVNF